MLKTKIIEILRGTLPSSQDTPNLEHIADQIVEAILPEFADAVAKAINAYRGKDD